MPRWPSPVTRNAYPNRQPLTANTYHGGHEDCHGRRAAYPVFMRSLLLLALALTAVSAFAEDVPTKMTVRGKELYREDFAKPFAKYTGKPNGYASGFEGWLVHGTGPESRGGQWRLVDGRFHGSENPQVKHPATASYGIKFQNIILQCQVRLEDVELDKDPAHGRKFRYLQLRATNEKSYLCSLSLNQGGFQINKDDNDRDGPDKMQVLVTHKKALAVGQWHTVLIEIMGDEYVATVDGHSVAAQHPSIAQLKHSFMIVTGPEGSVRDLRLWEAKPNADWPMTRAVLAAEQNPVAPAKK